MADTDQEVPYEYTTDYFKQRSAAKRAERTGGTTTQQPGDTAPVGTPPGMEWRVKGVVPPGGAMPGLPADYRGASQPQFVAGMPSGYISPPTGEGTQVYTGEDQGYIRKAAIFGNQLITNSLQIPAAIARYGMDFVHHLTKDSSASGIPAFQKHPYQLEPDYIVDRGTLPSLQPRTSGERTAAQSGVAAGTTLPLAATSGGISPWGASLEGRSAAFGATVQALRESGHDQLADTLRDYGGFALIPGGGRGFGALTGPRVGASVGAGGIAGGGAAAGGMVTPPSREEDIVSGLRGGEAARAVIDFTRHPGVAGAIGLGTMLTGLYGPEIMRRINLMPTPSGAARAVAGGAIGRIAGDNYFPTPIAPPSPERLRQSQMTAEQLEQDRRGTQIPP